MQDEIDITDLAHHPDGHRLERAGTLLLRSPASEDRNGVVTPVMGGALSTHVFVQAGQRVQLMHPIDLTPGPKPPSEMKVHVDGQIKFRETQMFDGIRVWFAAR